MIKATDLRIGNWVTPIAEEPKRVVSINESVDMKEVFYLIGLENRGNHVMPRHLLPTQLSPSILENAGFKKSENSNEYWTFWILPNSWHIAQSHHNEKSAGVEVGKFYWGDDYMQVNSLHHLQNLYHSLTGEELTINL